MKTEQNGNKNGSEQEREEIMSLISSLSLEDKFRLMMKLRALKATEA